MIKTVKIPHQATQLFSKLITDYLNQDSFLAPFYGNSPDLKGLKKQVASKPLLNSQTRNDLVNTLKEQYKGIKLNSETSKAIDSLKDNYTFTITTGHQLNLFTGPLYTIYKIVSVIKLSQILTKEMPEQNFVPVFWMATEDHDFEEINHFNIADNRIEWNRETSGAVGDLSTEGLEEVYAQFEKIVGDNETASYLKKIFKESYLKNNNLASATRFLYHTLFSEFGLVILDANTHVLKKHFKTHVLNELQEQFVEKTVSKTIDAFQNHYPIQAKPRPINLFYLSKNNRERIILLENGDFQLANSLRKISRTQLLDEVENFPEKFSPNVLMRPLYQEVVLPNIAYIGGGGELSYWLQLKNYFDKSEVCFPVLLLRSSGQFIHQKQLSKLEKLDCSISDFYKDIQVLITEKVKAFSEFPIDFSPQENHLINQFKELKELAKKTDYSFLNAVNAQEKKQLKGLKNLEKRLLKAQRKKLEERVNQLQKIHTQFFPEGVFEERHQNLSVYYQLLGTQMIKMLLEEMNPLENSIYHFITP